jgi:Zn-dependent proteases
LFDRLGIWVEWVKVSPVDFAIYFVFLAVTVLGSLTMHEYAHGYVAYRCGDPTAKMLGRLSLNPLKHLDPIGTLFMFFMGFGWAKPVPVNPRNFNNYRRDDIAVSVAGICVNLTVFIISLAVCVALNGLVFSTSVVPMVFGMKQNEFLQWGMFEGLFQYLSQNGMTVAELFESPVLFYVQLFFSMLASINLGLGLFNLLPIPPLDGFHVLNDILLKGKLMMGGQLFQMMRIGLLVLIFTGVLNEALSTMIDTVFDAVLNLFLMIAGKA